MFTGEDIFSGGPGEVPVGKSVSLQLLAYQGRRNTFEIGGAEFLEAPPWLAPSFLF
jgi:hypothetical protein